MQLSMVVSTDRALRNVAAILIAAGSSVDKVVRCTVFLTNMSDFSSMNEVYATFFPENPPARTTVAVAQLPKDVLIEIQATALE
jgi:2-iminobutanoate/2-iminopropanoate deaminase